MKTAATGFAFAFMCMCDYVYMHVCVRMCACFFCVLCSALAIIYAYMRNRYLKCVLLLL